MGNSHATSSVNSISSRVCGEHNPGGQEAWVLGSSMCSSRREREEEVRTPVRGERQAESLVRALQQEPEEVGRSGTGSRRLRAA